MPPRNEGAVGGWGCYAREGQIELRTRTCRRVTTLRYYRKYPLLDLRKGKFSVSRKQPSTGQQLMKKRRKLFIWSLLAFKRIREGGMEPSCPPALTKLAPKPTRGLTVPHHSVILVSLLWPLTPGPFFFTLVNAVPCQEPAPVTQLTMAQGQCEPSDTRSVVIPAGPLNYIETQGSYISITAKGRL